MARVRTILTGVAASSALAMAGPALAQININYGDFLGPNPVAGDVDYLQVTETSATSSTALYGAPTRVGNSLFFFPTSWDANAAGAGGSSTTTSGLQVVIRAAAGFFLDVVTIQEFGDWQLTGVGTSATSINASGSMFVTDLVPGTNGTLSDATAVSPVMPLALPPNANGTWNGATQVDLTGLGVSEIQLLFNTNLSATSEAGTTAFIQKKVIQGPSLIISVIPSPGAGALAAAAGIVALRRRRR